jgi:hypothetical protein
MKAVAKALRTRVIGTTLIDLLLLPFAYLSARVLLLVRTLGFRDMKRCQAALLNVGVMPIHRHYYEPLFDKRDLARPLSADRLLPGFDLNVQEQLSILSEFRYNEEFAGLRDEKTDDMTFHFRNGLFESGDAEYWYNTVRHRKPKTLIEIGSGNSTKLAALAIARNRQEDPDYRCAHICIEPYEMPWLEALGVTVLRQKVEEVGMAPFAKLGPGDILFIDSSHIIRPQGDVLFEYLELLPRLNEGVLVHVHDIFTPRDYPERWIFGDVLFWNEQYLLEAFLTGNPHWRIVGALNYLHHHHFQALKAQCPRLRPEDEPGSFYLMRQK